MKNSYISQAKKHLLGGGTQHCFPIFFMSGLRTQLILTSVSAFNMLLFVI